MSERTVTFQPTPNPAAGKFTVHGETVVESGSRSFQDAEQARGTPVAEALFSLDGVASVFMVADFITVTKTPDAGWKTLVPQVIEAIRRTL